MVIQEKNRPLNKVFVVEDEDCLRLVLSEQLKKMGFTVFSFSNGRVALESIGVDKPDLIIMDYSMPVMDGITAARLLRQSKETSSIPIIMISADNIQTSFCKFHFLSKPFLLGDLQLVIQDVRSLYL